jgi:hypothetical protein
MTPLNNKKRKNPFVKDDEEESNDREDFAAFMKSKTLEKKKDSLDDDSDEVREIPSFQKTVQPLKKKTTSLSDLFEMSNDEENMPSEIDLVKPIRNVVPVKPNNSGAVGNGRGLVKMNSFALGDSSSRSNTGRLLNESVEMKPLTSTGYYFQYDGLGGRKKMPAKSESFKKTSAVTSTSSSTTASKMSKFSRSKVT